MTSRFRILSESPEHRVAREKKEAAEREVTHEKMRGQGMGAVGWIVPRKPPPEAPTPAQEPQEAPEAEA